MTALHALLAGSIDYAGLFPPAELALRDAAENYAAYRASDERWSLGRFVVPAARLRELEQTAADLLPPRMAGDPWRLSVLLGTDPTADFRVIRELNARNTGEDGGAMVADSVEGKAATPDAVDSVLASIPAQLEAYVEIPVDRDPAPLVSAIAARRARAKIRTGGITADAFPSTPDVARFIAACVTSGVPFKATAGLHHPLRGRYPLTYEHGSPNGSMFGFLNLFVASAFAAQGMGIPDVERILDDGSPESFLVAADSIIWCGRRLGPRAIEAARAGTIVSFGSCSFTEPMSDLAAIGLL
jgi:hypothetical protein